MPKTRSIDTAAPDLTCDVCGRTLLRGERAEPFLAGGHRRLVCELCTGRAAHEGWIREAGGDDLAARLPRAERGRSLIDRFRARREQARNLEAEIAAEEAGLSAAPAGSPARAESAPVAREPRHVRAVPTNAELKAERALDVFNASDHIRTVGGVARSLGAPAVCVRPTEDRPSVVTITVMWELSWYRYEVDLSDEAGGVRRSAQGAELADLGPEELFANAAADERGAIHLAA